MTNEVMQHELEGLVRPGGMNRPFKTNPFDNTRGWPWRCVADDPVGVVISLTADRKPVCPHHGTKHCVVRRFVHHFDGCKQGRPFGRKAPEHRVSEVERVTCTNCLRKLGFRQCWPCGGKGPDGICTRCTGYGYYHKDEV